MILFLIQFNFCITNDRLDKKVIVISKKSKIVIPDWIKKKNATINPKNKGAKWFHMQQL